MKKTPKIPKSSNPILWGKYEKTHEIIGKKGNNNSYNSSNTSLVNIMTLNHYLRNPNELTSNSVPFNHVWLTVHSLLPF